MLLPFSLEDCSQNFSMFFHQRSENKSSGFSFNPLGEFSFPLSCFSHSLYVPFYSGTTRQSIKMIINSARSKQTMMAGCESITAPCWSRKSHKFNFNPSINGSIRVWRLPIPSEFLWKSNWHGFRSIEHLSVHLRSIAREWKRFIGAKLDLISIWIDGPASGHILDMM